MQKILTIAIPTFNRREFIETSLDSIFCQFDERVEVLVSDNCSTDGTERFVKTYYPQVRYEKNNENIGADRNFWECYKKANGKFVLLLGDDDILIDGALKAVLDFLEQNPNLVLLFLNHTHFTGKFKGIKKCSSPFVKDINDFVTTDKKQFMSIVKQQLTFMSDIIARTDSIRNISDIEKYIGTSFFHTCVYFECAKKEGALLGYISNVCIAQNMTSDITKVNPRWSFEVFGIKEKYVYCTVGVECGFNKNQLNKIYSSVATRGFAGFVMYLKSHNFIGWQNDFWSYAYPAVREYPKAWFTVIPATLCPNWIAKILWKLKH